MAVTTTPNLGLMKPDYDELADIDVINDNMDAIDSAWGTTSRTTTAADVIDAGANITIDSVVYLVYGKVVHLSISFSSSQAIADGAQVTVGQVKSGKRPAATAVLGSPRFVGGIVANGTVYARNITGSSIAANTSVTAAATYLLP